jgi:DNA-directed RNA polymerase, mitochondrial
LWQPNLRQLRLHSTVLPKENKKLILPYIYEIDDESVFQQTELPSFYFSEAVPIDENLEKFSLMSSRGVRSRLSEGRLFHETVAVSPSSSPPSPPEVPRDLGNLPLEERQLQIEKRQSTFGELESIEMTKKLMEMGKSASLKSLQKVFLQWYDPLYNELLRERDGFKTGSSKTNDIKYFGPLLVQLPLEKIAVTILNTTLDLVLQSRNSGIQISQLANEISNILQIEKNYSSAQASDRKKKQWLQDLTQEAQGKRGKLPMVSRKILKYLDCKEWDRDIKLKIGVALVSMLIQVCRDEANECAFVHDYKESSTKTRHFIGVIRLSESSYDTLLSEVDHNNAGTRYLPMLIPPVPWTPEQCGGYLTHHTTLLRYRSKSQLSVLRSANLQQVHHSLNYLGSIPWKVNRRVIDVMKELYSRGELVGELPSREILEPPSEEDFFVPRSQLKVYSKTSLESATATEEAPVDDNEMVLNTREYKYQCRRVRQKNAENHSLRCDLEIKFNIADEFRDDVIYFPWNVDFRGRAYPVPPNLNHMGSDKCRGMLYFAVGKPLGKRGFEWLKIHLCNLFGNNKISLSDRIKWTEEHLSQILESAENPIEGERWWATAEEPYQALATCFEIAEAMKCENPESYVCNLPVHQDGSCNGLQHYAALGRDLAGGSAVNLTPADRPQDVYTEVLKRVLMRIDEDANRELDEDSSSTGTQSGVASSESRQLLKQLQEKNKKFAQLVQGKVDRKVIKQTVMTSVYGVTAIGARDQVHSKLVEKLFPDGTVSQDEDNEAFAAARCFLSPSHHFSPLTL